MESLTISKIYKSFNFLFDFNFEFNLDFYWTIPANLGDFIFRVFSSVFRKNNGKFWSILTTWNKNSRAFKDISKRNVFRDIPGPRRPYLIRKQCCWLKKNDRSCVPDRQDILPLFLEKIYTPFVWLPTISQTQFNSFC